MIEDHLRRHVAGSREIPAWLACDADPEPTFAISLLRSAASTLYIAVSLLLAGLIGALIGCIMS